MSILLVKVIDSGGLTVPDTPEFMSDECKAYYIYPSLSLLLLVTCISDKLSTFTSYSLTFYTILSSLLLKCLEVMEIMES